MGDLSNIFEIVRDHGSKPGRGKEDALVAKGWISQEDMQAFIPAAARARHARPRGRLRPSSRRMTPSEAQQVITNLVRQWLDSLSP
jgi:hypothetical protein